MKSNQFSTWHRAVLASITVISLNFHSAASLAGETTAAPPEPGNKSIPARLTVKQLAAHPAAYAGRKVELQGFVVDYCKHMGCWALIHDNDPAAEGQIRVKQEEGTAGFKAFLPEIQGKSIVVSGEVKETRIDTEYLDRWEASVKESREAAGKGAEKAPAKGKTGDGTKANAKAKAKGDPSKEADPFAAALRQIADYRERVAKSKDGYVSSASIAVSRWELAPAKH